MFWAIMGVKNQLYFVDEKFLSFQIEFQTTFVLGIFRFVLHFRDLEPKNGQKKRKNDQMVTTVPPMVMTPTSKNWDMVVDIICHRFRIN